MKGVDPELPPAKGAGKGTAVSIVLSSLMQTITASMKKYLKHGKKITFRRADKNDSNTSCFNSSGLGMLSFGGLKVPIFRTRFSILVHRAYDVGNCFLEASFPN